MSTPSPLRRSLSRIKGQLVHVMRRQLLDTGLDRLARSRDVPGRAVLRALVQGWGNTGWSAQPEYLAECIRQRRLARGTSVECGSGLSTLVVGIVAQQAGMQHVALEHDAGWCRTVAAAARERGLDNVRVVHAPLRDYGLCDWYDVEAIPLPDEIPLLICDGPPGSTRGGRWGALPVLRGRLSAGAVVLVDDVQREAEQRMLARWRIEFGAIARASGKAKPYAIVRVPWSSLPGTILSGPAVPAPALRPTGT